MYMYHIFFMLFNDAEWCFEIIIFSVISGYTKDKCFHSDVRQNLIYLFFFFSFLKSQFFRSAGNVIQQIKKFLP